MRAFFLAPLLLAACAPVNGGPGSPPASGACDASPAQSLVGQAGTSELAAKARDLSGATVVRWLTPGMIVTKEYRADRLNIEIDGNSIVTAIRCG